MKKVVSLVGARPQLIKEAVVGAEVRRRGAWDHVLVHSGQHYDETCQVPSLMNWTSSPNTTWE